MLDINNFSVELKEISSKDYKSEAGQIYKRGKGSPNTFDFNKWFPELLRKDVDGSWIYLAGKNWDWDSFDFEKALVSMLNKENLENKWLFLAGKNWKKFNKTRALASLKRNSSYYYERAKKEWRWGSSAKEALNKTKRKTSKAKKIKDKEMVLESSSMKRRAQAIYFAGKANTPNFSYEKNLDTLISLARETKEEREQIAFFIFDAGVNWNSFNFKKGQEALGELDKTGFIIYLAGGRWKEFDFKKGFNDLIRVDPNGYHIQLAGEHWEEFDYKRGLEALIKADRRGDYIFKAGISWQKFDYTRGRKVLKERSSFLYDSSFEYWPKSAKETLNKIGKEKNKIPKTPDKKMVLENTDTDKEVKFGPTSRIYKAGIDYDLNQNKNNLNHIKLFNALLERDKDGQWIFLAGKDWVKGIFDYKKALDALVKVDKNGYWISRAGDGSWGKNNFDYKKGFEELLKKDKKGASIMDAGVRWPSRGFDYDKGYNSLIGKEGELNLIYQAGRDWPKDKFNFDRAIDFLIEKGKTEYYLFRVGMEWPKDKFDYNKILNALIKKDKKGEFIYLAGRNWPLKSFDYKRGYEALKKLEGEYYKKALENWPISAKETLGRIKDKTSKVEKIKDKKMVLESSGDFIFIKDKSEAYKIYTGEEDPERKYYFKERFEKLLEKDIDGRWIAMAGWGWRWGGFDYPRAQKRIEELDRNGEVLQITGDIWRGKFNPVSGLKALVKKKNSAPFIFFAGNSWRDFDFEKGLECLRITDKQDGYWIYKAGCDWDRFNFSVGLEYLLDADGIGKNTFEAGRRWKEFNFAKAQKHLQKENIDSQYLFLAGEEWKEFDYLEGLKHLVKKDSTKRWLKDVGKYWKKLNRREALKTLKRYDIENGTDFYKTAYDTWPKSASEALEVSKEKTSGVPKVADKKMVLEDTKLGLEYLRKAKKIFKKGIEEEEGFDYKKGLEGLFKYDEEGYFIYNAGDLWKEFDYERGLEELSKRKKGSAYIYLAGKVWKKFNFDKGVELLIKTDAVDGRWIHEATIGWKRFDFDKALGLLKERYNKDNSFVFYKKALENWPITAKETLDRIKEKLSKTEKVKDKKMVLEDTEDIEYLKNKSSIHVYTSGEDWDNFDFEKGMEILFSKRDEHVTGSILASGTRWRKFDHKKGLDALIKIAREYKNVNQKGVNTIYLAGLRWASFDFEKGLEALKELDIVGEWIFLAGKDWDRFDFKKGLEALVGKEKEAYFIHLAGNYWKEFDHKRGLEILRNSKDKNRDRYHKESLKTWPKKASVILDKISNELTNVRKVKDKKMVLEDADNKWEIYKILRAQKYKKDFDYEKNLDEIIQKDNSGGRWIYRVGCYWKNFDYEKGLDAIIKKIEKGSVIESWIYRAGRDWKHFNFNKAFKAIKEAGGKKAAFLIRTAGEEWKGFDLNYALNMLIEEDKKGEQIYSAGLSWKQFDYKKAFKALERIEGQEYYKKALDNWPPSATETLKKLKDETDKAKKVPDKKMALEDTEILKTN